MDWANASAAVSQSKAHLAEEIRGLTPAARFVTNPERDDVTDMGTAAARFGGAALAIADQGADENHDFFSGSGSGSSYVIGKAVNTKERANRFATPFFDLGVLQAYADREGHAQVPVARLENGLPLGRSFDRRRHGREHPKLARRATTPW